LNSEAHDEAVIAACKTFLATHRKCAELSTRDVDQMSVATLDEFRTNAQARSQGLRDIQSWRASGLTALDAKYEVLCVLETWLTFDDPRLARFAVQLASEYRDAASGSIDEGWPSRRLGRMTSSVGLWLGLSRLLGCTMNLRAVL
jgi:hypothetical protein